MQRNVTPVFGMTKYGLALACIPPLVLVFCVPSRTDKGAIKNETVTPEQGDGMCNAQPAMYCLKSGR
jgi:hypothetical protein